MGEFDGAFRAATVGRGKYLRSTRALPMAGLGRNVTFEVLGLREAALIPKQLRRAYDLMLRSLENELAAAARAVVPGGPGGRLGRQVHARRVGNRIVIGTVGSKFARALDRGFTSTPKTARALRFGDGGGTVFTMKTRVAGRHFFAKWIALTPPIVERTYNASFYNIKRPV